MIKLLIPGTVRAKKNRLRPIPIPTKKPTPYMFRYKGRGVKPVQVILKADAVYQKWEKEVRQAVIAQLPAGFKIIDYPVSVEAVFYYKGPQPDTTGAFEALNDALEGVVFTDDKLVEVIMGDKVHDLKNPHIEVCITKLERD